MELILITNDERLAKYAEECGVDRIAVDLEIIGKRERQKGRNTVISGHTLEDVRKIRKILKKSKLMVRINPIHQNSQLEVETAIEFGAEILMLPMFETRWEVEKFINWVNGRAITSLLLETAPALVRLDDILSIDGINEVYVGLNDLHLQMGLAFMFELLSGGIVEYVANKVNSKGIKFGFGGISRLGHGLIDSFLVLSEHVRLNSKMVILSRDFKGYLESFDEIIKNINIAEEIRKIRECIKSLRNAPPDLLIKNREILRKKVAEIVYTKLLKT